MTPESDHVSFLRVIVAFALVCGMMGVLGFGLKYLSMRGIKWPGAPMGTKRMELVESLAIDARRRLVIVRCDGNEHLLLLGANQDLVVQQNLAASRKKPA